MSNRKKLNKLRQFGIGWIFLIVMGFFIFLIFIPNNGVNKIKFPDLHGLSYSEDGGKLVAAVHDGLKVYSDSSWSVPDIPKNDYMGYSPVKNGFYSSGHPAPGSNLKNPLGIVKSKDNGETVEIVDFQGEADFHALSVGYETEEIYVFAAEPNSKMKEQGFYYSSDQGETWNLMNMQGVSGSPLTMAAHPSKNGTLAIGTDQGLYLSENYGNTFDKILAEISVSATVFAGNDTIIAGTNNGNNEITEVNINNNKSTNYSMPKNSEGNITFIAVNNKNKKELSFATDQLNIYTTTDSGETWDKIVEEGAGKNTGKN
ncbi:F510_1955 family glycosylhydrolase [Cytobacillus sp. FSL W8-0315]|uniref:F510_1955 family glycosylhydrolase n=1 Tax=Cytobacillus TaxID=2675230 RepID=UPI0001F4574F|nr:hypothetical protein [Cytobacillus pseudoceanisediminis]EFV74658.1 hypothetical protein HMPREF1013_05115 [Bacillus sp. 2_A_57_CT2]UQX57164.1 hypothetical protein M5V91_28925 [Cytobacillus pseudoceanisediminis]